MTQSPADTLQLPYGPGSISRHVLRRPEYMLGGMSALLLQLADPRVAAAVADHSDFAHRIFDRLRSTMDVMVEIGVGEPEDGRRALHEFRRSHRGVRGTTPDGSPYDARDPELRLWVFATLIATAMSVEARYADEFDEDDRRRYYMESLVMASVLGVEEAPPDLNAFRSYMATRLDSLQVTDQAREIARQVLSPHIGWIPGFVFAPLHVIAADLLPRQIRIAYGLRLSTTQRRWLRRIQALSRATLPRIPEPIRTFPVLHPLHGLRDHLMVAAGR